MEPVVDIAKLEPVLDWKGGLLRVYANPHTSTKLEPAKEHVPFGRGYALPLRWCSTRPDGVRGDFAVIDGVPRLVAITATGEHPPGAEDGPDAVGWLSGEYLRSLAGDRDAARTAQHVAVRLYRRPRGEVVGVDRMAVPDVLDEWARLSAAVRASGERRRGRKPLPDATLIAAAKAARGALGRGESQVVAVMDACHVETSTAKKYMRQARERGFLAGPTTEGEDDGK